MTVTDICGNATPCTTTFTVNNDPPVIPAGGVTGPSGPIAKGNPASITVSFTDTGNQGHSYTFSWDDGSPNTTGSFSTNGPSGSYTANHTYAAAGVYSVTVTVTDDCGAASDAYIFQYVVVYDPQGGFVTGGGWIISPTDAYAANPSLTGRANFGFVSKYQRGASIPTGETEFQFQMANFNFHSTVYEWLVVAGPKAQYKGSGTINGSGDYGFLLTATDGQVNGGGGMDKFRIRIWDKLTNTPIYDNAPGPDDIDASNFTILSGGSIVVHK
jgi:PKD domain